MKIKQMPESFLINQRLALSPAISLAHFNCRCLFPCTALTLIANKRLKCLPKMSKAKSERK